MTTDTGKKPTDADIAYWCETVLEQPDSPTTCQALERLAGVANPGLMLRVAADLWQDNPNGTDLQKLDELEYLDIVLAVEQVTGQLPNDPNRVAADLRDSLLSRWNSKADAAADLIDHCLGAQWAATMGVNRDRLTGEDIEMVERDATGGHGVSIAETDDGWYVIVDGTVG